MKKIKITYRKCYSVGSRTDWQLDFEKRVKINLFNDEAVFPSKDNKLRITLNDSEMDELIKANPELDFFNDTSEQYIRKFIEFSLNENVNKNYIYHFTHIMNFLLILQDNFFICKYNDLPKIADENFAISCTRNKSFLWGVVRLTLDYEKIKKRYKVLPVSYFKNNRTQFEERIFTNKETFPIFDYLISVDFCTSLNHNNDDLTQIIQKLEILKIPFEFVDKF